MLTLAIMVFVPNLRLSQAIAVQSPEFSKIANATPWLSPPLTKMFGNKVETQSETLSKPLMI